MIRKGKSLEWLLEEPIDADELLWDHKMDISGSIYKRMKECGVSQSELARKMKMDRAQLSKILSGNGNITLRTIARLEVALDFRLDAGFRYGLDASCQVAEVSAWAQPYSRWASNVKKIRTEPLRLAEREKAA